jgi:hypothetical protein
MNEVLWIVACAAVAPLIVALFIARAHANRTPLMADDWEPDWNEVPAAERRLVSEPLDMPSLVREVADSLAPLAWERFTRIVIAVSPGRALHADPGALGIALRDTVAAALRASSGGQVLVSVVPLGMGVQIVVTDEGADCDQLTREADVMGACSLLALMGGSVSVVARPGTGCTVTLRLPVAGSVHGGQPDHGRSASSFGVKGVPVTESPGMEAEDVMNQVS